MSFNAFEISTRSGKPVFLYRFSLGTQHWNYTSDIESHDYLSETYTPLEINTSGTSQSQEVNAQRITISSSKDWILPRQFVSFVPALQMFVTIFKFHRDDPADVYTYWQGSVRSAKHDDKQSSLMCEPVTALLDRLGLRMAFSSLCGKVLYDGYCPVPASAFRVDGILSGDPVGFTIQAPEWDVQPDSWYTLGYAERALITGVIDMRFITGHVGDTLTLLSPFPYDLSGGETIRAYAGCDRLFATCAGKFGAYTDTGGACGCYNRVPKKNLFKTGLKNAG